MLIGPHLLQSLFDVRPHGVLHVGAHEAEEAEAYRELGWGPVVWVEMLPDKSQALRERFRDDPANRVVEAAAWSSSGCTRALYEASNSQSSSLFPPRTHLMAHPEISFSRGSIRTRRLDEILDPALPFDFLNLDCQGAELEAIRGLGSMLDRVRWCYLEVNLDLLYEGIPLRDEVDRFMLARGFTRVAESIHAHLGWGDALYANGRRLPPQRIFALKLRGAAWQRRQRDVLDLAGDALIEHLRDQALRGTT